MPKRTENARRFNAVTSNRKRTSERPSSADPVNDAHPAHNDHPPAPRPSPAPVHDPWLEACLAHHSAALMRKLRRIVGKNEHDAEDAIQGVFTRFDRIPAELRALKPDDPEVWAWLLTAASHQAIDHYRARESDKARIQVAARRGLLPVDLSQAQERDATLLGRLDREDEQDADRQKAVAAAIDDLPDEQRSALVEKHLERRRVADMAESHGIGISTLYALVKQAIAGVQSLVL